MEARHVHGHESGADGGLPAVVDYTHTLPEWRDPAGADSVPIETHAILEALGKPPEVIDEIQEVIQFYKAVK
jgi:hypothetical protein